MGTFRNDRIVKFMNLFTPEEKAKWATLGEGGAPDWVVQGILWFMDQDPAHQRLMERLAEDD